MYVPFIDAVWGNLIITPWNYKQVCKTSLAPGQCLTWKAKHGDKSEEQGELHCSNNVRINGLTKTCSGSERIRDTLAQMG